MKRYAILPLVAAALAGCAKFASETVETVPVGENTPFVIYVGLPETTKTSFDEASYTVTWSDGDALAVKINGQNNTDKKPYQFVKVKGEDNTFSCSDFHPVDGETYEYDILYPYSADGKFTMSGGVKAPMHGVGKATGKDSPNVRLDQLTALIKVTVNNANALGTATLTSISVERADGGILGGKHKMEGSTVVPVEGETVSSTTVGSQNKKIAAGTGVDMYLQCAPFTAEASSKLLIKYTVDGVEYVTEKTFSKEVEFEAGKVNRTSVSFAAEPCAIEGSAVAGGSQSMTKCLEKDNLYAFKAELSEGDFHIRLTGDNGGIYAPASGNDISDGRTVELTKNENGHWTVPSAGVYRVVVDFDAKTVAIYSAATDEVVYTATEWKNTVDPKNPITEKTVISELWMWGDFANEAYGNTGSENYKLIQSLANPRIFTYYKNGVALPRNGKATVKFMVSGLVNNSYAYGATATRDKHMQTELGVKVTEVYGGQGDNRYSRWIIPEGANYIEVYIGSKENEKIDGAIVTASDAYVLFDKR